MMKGGGKANAVNCSNGQLLKLVTDHSGRGGAGVGNNQFLFTLCKYHKIC